MKLLFFSLGKYYYSPIFVGYYALCVGINAENKGVSHCLLIQEHLLS